VFSRVFYAQACSSVKHFLGRKREFQHVFSSFPRSLVFHVCSTCASRVLHVYFTCASRVLSVRLTRVSRVFQASFAGEAFLARHSRFLVAIAIFNDGENITSTP
jgi:hypothetical protein